MPPLVCSLHNFFLCARSSRKENTKEAMVEQEKAELHAYINELAFRLEKQDAQLREMERVLAQLRKLFQIYCAPTVCTILFVKISRFK